MAKSSYVPAIGDEVPWATAHHLRLIYQKLGPISDAILTLNGKSAVSATTKIIQETSSSGGGGSATVIGAVNNQSGQTAYTTQPSDNGALIIFSDASPVAVTLGIASATPWFCFVTNLGAGTVTFTPASGTINGAATLHLLENFSLVIAFDGTNFWAAVSAIVPVNTPAVAHEWLASYDSATGAFTQTQPDYSDLTGTPQLPNTIADVSHEFLTSYAASSGNFTQAQPNFSDISGNLATSQLPTAGLSVTITTAQLTTGGTQGSMTFTNGILTAQTPAT